MFWYAVTVICTALLVWNYRFRRRVRRAEQITPALYDAAVQVLLRIRAGGLRPAEVVELLETTPLTDFAEAAEIYLGMATPDEWASLPPRMRDAACLQVMADTFGTLELRYTALFLSNEQRDLVAGLRRLNRAAN